MQSSILGHATLSETDAIASAFRAASPFPHVIIENFFRDDFCERLLSDFPAFDSEQAINENGLVGKKAVHQHISRISPAYRELDDLVKSRDFLTYVSRITGIDDLLYDPDYFGGGTHENLQGQELDPHVDFTMHPKMKAHRRLNLIIYLNRDWQQEWGGNIEFHRNPRLPRNEDEIITVPPVFNRAVLFETNNISWHGFERINLPEDKQHLSRKSVALYFYTKDRETMVKPHSTIYVERHLSDRFRPGMTLDDADMQELLVHLKRRNMHIERLYTNITNLMIQLDQYRAPATLSSSSNESIEQQTEKYAGYDRDALLARVLALENSTSWRITSPLRKLRLLLKKIQQE